MFPSSDGGDESYTWTNSLMRERRLMRRVPQILRRMSSNGRNKARRQRKRMFHAKAFSDARPGLSPLPVQGLSWKTMNRRATTLHADCFSTTHQLRRLIMQRSARRSACSDEIAHLNVECGAACGHSSSKNQELSTMRYDGAQPTAMSVTTRMTTAAAA